MRRSPDVRAAAFLVLLIVVIYADILFLGRGLYAAGVADLLGYHIPMKWVVRDIVTHGAFPYWNPFFSAGQPLAANPAYQIFYPLNWLILLPSFHFGFQLHIIVHFVIAALGMYLLLRGLGATPIAATFGGAVFVMSGPYLSVATKLPMLFALSWMPLALECARRAIDQPSRPRFAIAALVLSLQLIIAEPMIVAQTWMFIAGYAIWRREWRKDLLTMGGLALTAVLVAAVQLIPAFDFARDSVRSSAFTFADVADWSMPGLRLTELVFPSVFRPDAIATMYRGRTEAFVMEMYVGLFVVLLALAGALTAARGTRIALIAMCSSTLLAMGEHTPVLQWLYAAHVIRSIRYPEKWIVGGVFVLIVWAALLLDRLLQRDRRLVRTMLTVTVIWLALAVVAFLSANRAYFGQQLIRAVGVLFFVVLLQKTRLKLGAAILAASILDSWLATRYLVPRMPREFFDAPTIARTVPANARIYPKAFWQFLDSDPNVLDWIRGVPDKTYWWMLRNSMVDHLPARFGFGVILEGDIDRTSLKTTDDFREAMRDLAVRHVMAAEEPFLKMSGAGATLAYGPRDSVPTERTTPVGAEIREYPRFVFADRIQRVSTLRDLVSNLDLQRGLSNVAFADIEPFTPARGQVLQARETPNAISLDVRVDGPAFLILSITAHRYWSATIDGSAASLVPTDITYQGLRVPAGAHRVEMRYRNPWILPSAAISILSIIALGVGTMRRASAPA